MNDCDLNRIRCGDKDLYNCDLEGADLRGLDLSGADLEGANLQGAQLDHANLRGASLYDAELRGASLQRADFYGAGLEDANLDGSNLFQALNIVSYGPVGNSGRMIYAVKHEDTVMFKIGCHWGDYNETINAVFDKYGDNSHYHKAIEFMNEVLSCEQ